MKVKHSIVILILLSAAACKKHENNNKEIPWLTPTDSSYAPVDPSTPATVGFFSSGWAPKTWAAPADSFITVTMPSPVITDSMVIDVNNVLVKVPPTVYGANSNLWMTQIVNQPSLMQYITDLSPNIIRGPGGSISDVYFWNGTDAMPRPADAPDSVITGGSLGPIGSWYGGNTSSGTLSLNNYYSLLTQTNSTGIITINYGYARYGTSSDPVDSAAHLAADWVRADNGKTKYWEIGNEDYGSWEAGYQIPSNNVAGQPQTISGSLYGQQATIIADSMRAAAQETGATIYIGAVLYNAPTTSSDDPVIQNWNQGVLKNFGNSADFFIVHDYFTPYNGNTDAADILSTGNTEAPAVMSFIKSQLAANNVSTKPIAMTEWNIQATGSKQSTSYIAGMHAALTLGSFIKNQYGEASRWDLANGPGTGTDDDQGMFNNGSEVGAPLWNPRPSFFYMYYFQKCFGDRMVYDTLRQLDGQLTAYASTFNSGQASAVIINSDQFNHIMTIDVQHFPAGSRYHWYVLTGGTDNAPFSNQVYVNGIGPSTATGGPLNYASIKPYGATLSGQIKLYVPTMSVIYLVVDHK